MLFRVCLSRPFLAFAMAMAIVPFSFAQEEGGRGGRGQGGGPGGPGGRMGPGGGMMRGMMGGGGMGGGGLFGLLMMKEVCDELKLDEDQTSELEAMKKEAQDSMRSMFEGRSRTERPDQAAMEAAGAKMREMNKKREEKLEELLDPNQMDRLVGLLAQQQGLMSLSNALIATRLGITSEQKAKMTEMEKEAGEAMRSIFSNGPPGPEAFEKMQAMRKEGEAKLLALLTDEQKKSLEDMKGEAFKFPEMPRWGGGGRGNRGGQGPNN